MRSASAVPLCKPTNNVQLKCRYLHEDICYFDIKTFNNFCHICYGVYYSLDM
jgi:hypothetical protein